MKSFTEAPTFISTIFGGAAGSIDKRTPNRVALGAVLLHTEHVAPGGGGVRNELQGLLVVNH